MRAFIRRLAATLKRRRLDQELREEIDAHIEARRDALVADGMDEREAAAEARRQFGNVTALAERTREARGFPTIESFAQDVRFGMRLFWRAPLFVLVATLSIAGGVGGGIAVFTIANAIILRPIAGGVDLYRIYTSARSGERFNNNSHADFLDFASATQAFSSMCATEEVRANLEARGAAAMRSGAIVSGDCFRTLGLRPHAGRLIAPGGGPDVVISYALWKRQFGADRSAIGMPIRLSGVEATIVGVAPRGFSGTSLDFSADFWVAPDHFRTLLPAGALQDRRDRRFTVYGTLRDGASREQAEAALAGIASALQQSDPAAWTDAAGAVRRVTVMRETDARFVGAPAGAQAALLLSVAGAIAALVAIACVNLATMLLARGAARRRELTIRLALGATRVRLLRQLATESLLIAASGAAAALLAIAAAIRWFEANRPEGIPAVDLAIDWRVALFAVASAVFATVLFGLAPAMHVVRLAIAEGMKGRAAMIRARWLRAGAREILIVVQVAASVALLVVSAIFARGLSEGAAASPGFASDGIATVGVDLSPIPGSEAALAARIIQAVRSVDAVDTAALVGVLPLTGSSTGYEIQDGGAGRTVDANILSPGYLGIMGIPLRAGRDFADTDRAGSPRVAIASETLARTLWKTTNVVGRTVTMDGNSVEMVGVAADTRYRALNEPYRPLLYLPFAQQPRARFVLHARVRGGGETLAALERAARSVDPRILVDNAVPLGQRLAEIRAPERAAQWLVGAGGAAQFGLVLMSLWALVAYAVERRTQEIGVRVALGATPRAVVNMVVRPAVLLIAIGAILGSAIGVAAATILESNFVGLADVEPGAGVPMIALMGIIAVVAALVPGRRASRVDPVVALRAE